MLFQRCLPTYARNRKEFLAVLRSPFSTLRHVIAGGKLVCWPSPGRCCWLISYQVGSQATSKPAWLSSISSVRSCPPLAQPRSCSQSFIHSLDSSSHSCLINSSIIHHVEPQKASGSGGTEYTISLATRSGQRVGRFLFWRGLQHLIFCLPTNCSTDRRANGTGA